ncbi:nitric oxide reductase activation protein NorD [Solemya velum gill symbiont]|nr:VWA domain-containing protein [Solemya velum gill symbiont]
MKGRQASLQVDANMEEQVGAFWHRFITRMADDHFPDAAVCLDEVRETVGILFRALGGDGGLRIEAVDATAISMRRKLLQRIAGSHNKVELAWRDERSLRLPLSLDWFPHRSLNRDLYLWLSALAVSDHPHRQEWYVHNQELTRNTLQQFPGMRARYKRLVEAHLEQRPTRGRLNHAEAEAEQLLRQALTNPGSVTRLPDINRDPYPIPLWLHPAPPGTQLQPEDDVDENNNDHGGVSHTPENAKRKQAQRVDSPESDRGLITVRMENIFTWGEFVNVDRGQEDDEDLGRAEAIADDLDKLAVARNRRSSAASLKFDLDLPSEADDDLVLDEGLLLPEWDWKRQELLPDACRIIHLVADAPGSLELPQHLVKTARRLRHQFQTLAPSRVWHRAQADGQEIDLDAYLRFAADRESGHGDTAHGLYRELRSGGRDLACFLLADLSLSTDTWINDQHRVIDVIRDALFLFAESLAATGDRFGIYGFSSRKRNPVRLHQLKEFDEKYSGEIRGRIGMIKPGYYTRLGAGIRYATRQLENQPANRRLLLILTDGKPNDIDKYEGRHGIEDTRHAVQAARKLGMQPFCVTIDTKGSEYLPHLFGSNNFVVIHDPGELPNRLPLLYARLTA